jgi:hypothetical protein
VTVGVLLLVMALRAGGASTPVTSTETAALAGCAVVGAAVDDEADEAVAGAVRSPPAAAGTGLPASRLA